MIFKLLRKENGPNYCMGRLYATMGVPPDPSGTPPEFYVCDTLEPRVEANRKGLDAVPAGIYELVVSKSPRLGRALPLLVDVPGRTGIRIHRGNTPSDTSGCILPGHYIGRGRLELSTVMELDIIRMLMDSTERSSIEIIDDFERPAPLGVEADRLPEASSGLMGRLAADMAWVRPAFSI